jgi:hypothetical protein
VVILQAQAPQFLTRRYCGGRQAARGREDDLSPTPSYPGLVAAKATPWLSLAVLGWGWDDPVGAPQATWNTLTPRQKRGKRPHTRFVLSLPP